MYHLDICLRYRSLIQGVLSFLLLSGSVLSIQPAVSATHKGAEKSIADPFKGEQVYQRCIGCHSMDRNRTGPRHCGLIGRQAGSVRGYDYSSAMAESDIVWDEHSLDTFLKSPLTVIPGTTMGFSGVAQNQDRRDLIAYLKQASDAEECR